MNDLSNSCIFCKATTNLNTTMDIKHNDKTYTIAVCEKDEDDATPKAIKIKIDERENEITAFLEQAKALGINIPTTQTASGLIIPEPQEAPPKEAGQKSPKYKSIKSSQKAAAQENNNKTTKVRKLRRVEAPESIELTYHDDQGRTKRVRHQQYQKKNQIVERTMKDGSKLPLVIPSETMSNAGTLKIRINKVTDAELQARAKGLHNDFHKTANHGMQQCNFCGGEGMVLVDNEQDVCPKCRGVGFN